MKGADGVDDAGGVKGANGANVVKSADDADGAKCVDDLLGNACRLFHDQSPDLLCLFIYLRRIVSGIVLIRE